MELVSLCPELQMDLEPLKDRLKLLDEFYVALHEITGRLGSVAWRRLIRREAVQRSFSNLLSGFRALRRAFSSIRHSQSITSVVSAKVESLQL